MLLKFILKITVGEPPGSRSYNRASLKKNEYKSDLKSDWTTKANYHIDFHLLWPVAKLDNSFIIQDLLSNEATNHKWEFNSILLWSYSALLPFGYITYNQNFEGYL